MSLPRLPFRAAGRPPGFTLVEALIALAVLGVALLLGVALVMQVPRDVRRLDAERQAMRAMEATLDGIRAGAVPLESSPPTDPTDPTDPTNPIARAARAGAPTTPDLRVRIKVDDTATPGLCQVTLTADYSVLNSKHEKRLLALFRGDC